MRARGTTAGDGEEQGGTARGGQEGHEPWDPRSVPRTPTMLLLLLPLLTLPLHDAGRVRGRVEDARGKPVAGAAVRIQSQVDPALAALEPDLVQVPQRYRVRTGKRGRFAASVSGGSLYRLQAVSADGRSISTVRHAVHANEIVRLTLVPACRLVLEMPRQEQERGGQGGVAWHLLGFDRDRREEFFLMRGEAPAAARTLPPLAPGRYRLRLRTRDARTFEVVLNLRPGEKRRVRPTFRPAALLRVVGPPEALATTHARLPFPFDFPGLQPATVRGPLALPAFGQVLRVAFERHGHATSEARLGPLHPGGSVGFELREGGGRRLELSVRRQDGSPARGRLVLAWEGRRREVRSIDYGGDPAPAAGLPRTEILAIFWDRNGERAVQRLPPAGSPRVEIRTRKGAQLVLSVLGDDGQPLQHARLFLFPATLRRAPGLESLFPTMLNYPDRRGSFRLLALPAGDWELRIEAPFHAPVQAPLTLVTGVVHEETYRLERGYRVHGRLLDPAGEPAAGVLVTMTYPLAGPRTVPLETLTDEAGRFRFDGVPDGEYLIEAGRSRGTRSELARQRVAPGPQEILLRLQDEDPRRK